MTPCDVLPCEPQTTVLVAPTQQYVTSTTSDPFGPDGKLPGTPWEWKFNGALVLMALTLVVVGAVIYNVWLAYRSRALTGIKKVAGSAHVVAERRGLPRERP